MEADPTEQALENMDKLIRKMKEDTVTLKKRGRLEEVSKELPPLEAAKLSSSLAYSINSLYKGTSC